jgi:anti-sigma-K factor RskA
MNSEQDEEFWFEVESWLSNSMELSKRQKFEKKLQNDSDLRKIVEETRNIKSESSLADFQKKLAKYKGIQ